MHFNIYGVHIMNPIRTQKSPLVIGVALWSAMIALNAFAEDCNQHFANSRTPTLINAKLGARTHQICYTSYSVLTSGVTKTAIWSAEHLTRDNIEMAQRLKRENPFHAEPSLSASDRAELSDYAHSGLDRGHMSPNGDMPNHDAQYESFSLANMIPQNPENNRGVWADLESDVRKLAKRSGEIYVVTGPAFIADANGQLDSLKSRVLVPTHLWKAVFDPVTQQTTAYWVSNNAESQIEQITVSELKARSGVDPFPALPESAKQGTIALSNSHVHRQQTAAAEETSPHGESKTEFVEKEVGRAALRHILHF